MFIIRSDGIVVDSVDGRPVAVFVDTFTTGMGVEAQAETVILRLHHTDWAKDGPVVPLPKVQQFALSARRAAELGRHLQELAAQAEKERDQPREH